MSSSRVSDIYHEIRVGWRVYSHCEVTKCQLHYAQTDLFLSRSSGVISLAHFCFCESMFAFLQRQCLNLDARTQSQRVVHTVAPLTFPVQEVSTSSSRRSPRHLVFSNFLPLNQPCTVLLHLCTSMVFLLTCLRLYEQLFLKNMPISQMFCPPSCLLEEMLTSWTGKMSGATVYMYIVAVQGWGLC